jgi:hypothetical protein
LFDVAGQPAGAVINQEIVAAFTTDPSDHGSNDRLLLPFGNMHSRMWYAMVIPIQRSNAKLNEASWLSSAST